MKTKILTLALSGLALAGCDNLDTMVDSYITQKNVENEYSNVIQMGYASYGYMRSGLNELDNNIAAAKSDEAVMTSLSAKVRMFNNGSWNAHNNPDNRYDDYYKGIRAANYFLDYSADYKNMLAIGRDTISKGGTEYKDDVENAAWLRAESHVIKAYYYFELIKRYGGVPLYTQVVNDRDFLPRATYQEVVDYIVSEIEAGMPDLAPTWKKKTSFDGRFNQGSALALKSRALLYAASPLNTEGLSTDQVKALWTKAAEAAAEVMALNTYSLSNSYASLFTGNTTSNPEVIMSRRASPSNSLERANYPIGTAGGNSGLTPSQNLVDAYEYTAAPDPANPYANRDPRLSYTIVTDGSTWNKRTIDIAENGSDSHLATNASRTGYYLKKYLTDELVLTQDQTAMHQWIYFRYAEILLNYAEAANEVWGPDDASHTSAGMSARQALNMVRNRADVNLGDVDLSKYPGTTDTDRMRAAVKAERRVELAFEDHRYWDLLRWKDGDALAQTIDGVRVAITPQGRRYDYVPVEERVFDTQRMYRYPIPFTEVSKSGGKVAQNQGW